MKTQEQEDREKLVEENVKVPCPKCGGCGQYMIDVKCDCRPQPTEQKECPDSDHLNHKDCPTKREWAMEAIKSANEEQAKVMEHCLPQPTEQKECKHKWQWHIGSQDGGLSIYYCEKCNAIHIPTT